MLPIRVCVKADSLRQTGRWQNLKEFVEDPQCLYVGRCGRVRIKEKDGSLITFAYPSSEFANPYKLTDCSSREECLVKYAHHLIATGLVQKLDKLSGKYLGCFCLPHEICHVDILIHYYQELFQ